MEKAQGVKASPLLRYIVLLLCATCFCSFVAVFTLQNGGLTTPQIPTPTIIHSQPYEPIVIKDSATATLYPTSLPTGIVLKTMKFASDDDKYCFGGNGEEGNYWGYDTVFEHFLINPRDSFYIVTCGYKSNPQESVQVTARVVSSSKEYEYGVMLGWNNQSNNYCAFGVGTDGQSTFGKFLERINGGVPTVTTIPIDWMNLDTKPYSVRLVVLPNAEAVGYVDNIFVGKNTFVSCDEGEVGFYASGPDNTTVFFDDLFLTSLPK